MNITNGSKFYLYRVESCTIKKRIKFKMDLGRSYPQNLKSVYFDINFIRIYYPWKVLWLNIDYSETFF